MPDVNETADHETADHETADHLDGIAVEIARRTQDAAYVAVGLGVLGLQRARALRHDLVRQGKIDDGVQELANGLSTGTHQVGEWLEATFATVSSQLAPLGAQLREPVKELTKELADKARGQLAAVGMQLRQIATPGN